MPWGEGPGSLSWADGLAQNSGGLLTEIEAREGGWSTLLQLQSKCVLSEPMPLVAKWIPGTSVLPQG